MIMYLLLGCFLDGISMIVLTLAVVEPLVRAAGIDLIMAGLKESMEAPPTTIDHHTHAIVFLYEYFRDPKPDEPGSDWIVDAQAQRAAAQTDPDVAAE